MADDIVTRLRRIVPIHEGRWGHDCIAEAADEIERLRAEINDSTKALSRNATALMKQVEENNRLRAECNATRHITEHFSQEADRG